MSEQVSSDFFAALGGWACDGYSLSINYLALQNTAGVMRLLRLAIIASPLPVKETLAFSVRTERIAAGAIVRNNVTRSEVSQVFNDAAQGTIIVDEEVFAFASRQISFESHLSDRVRWEYDLHLRINAPLTEGCKYDVTSFDRELRIVTPPFDGLQDLTSWLGLGGEKNQPTDFGKAELVVKPPVDCIIDETRLRDDRLHIVLAAHAGLDAAALNVALLATPGLGLTSRKQVAADIAWVVGEHGLLRGTGEILLENADSALLMLSLGDKTVRRQWFLDPVKARNARVFAAKHFDKDLRYLRRALLEDKDGPRFETAVCALLFLLGFAPAVQIETEAPDLLVATPAGRLVLVECTLKVADFRTKLGKLVDRRSSLIREMERTGHTAQLYAVLICRVPLDQLVYDPEELTQHDVILLSQPDVETGLSRVDAHNDPDSMLSDLTPGPGQ